VVKSVADHSVELDVWGEDADGKKTVVGSATVELA
jgi:hypothetical protein